MTCLAGKPEAFHATYTIASSGLLTTIITALGECLAMFSATLRTMPVLMLMRSSRLIPGLRATPAVTITTSLPAVGS